MRNSQRLPAQKQINPIQTKTASQHLFWLAAFAYYSMHYRTLSEHFHRLFGARVQKLSIDAGFSCPNRDGTTGSTEGCTFCRNDAFVPSYCRRTSSINEQIEEGIAFHRRRYRSSTRYMAYFQAYSNTHASIDILRQRYLQALQHPLIIGLVIGTRPDCIDTDRLNLLHDLSKKHYIAVEYGIESCYDHTLAAINRGHNLDCAIQAVELSATYGIPVGAHFILGLPGESYNDILNGTDLINRLPLTSIKFHQLQILRGTPMEHQYNTDQNFRNSILHLSLPNYIALLCDIIERLHPNIVIERLAGEVPPQYQAVPDRSFRHNNGYLLRNEEIGPLVEAEFIRRSSKQGAKFISSTAKPISL